VRSEEWLLGGRLIGCIGRRDSGRLKMFLEMMIFRVVAQHVFDVSLDLDFSSIKHSACRVLEFPVNVFDRSLLNSVSFSKYGDDRNAITLFWQVKTSRR